MTQTRRQIRQAARLRAARRESFLAFAGWLAIAAAMFAASALGFAFAYRLGFGAIGDSAQAVDGMLSLSAVVFLGATQPLALAWDALSTRP